MSDTSLTGTAINMFAAPKQAFPVIRDHPRPGFPLALILIGLIIVTVLYLNVVDLAWFFENQLRASPATAEMSEADIRRAVEGAARSPAFISAVSSISSAIFVTIMYVVMALYLWGASSIGKHGIRFAQAFALVCWCSLPGLLGFIAAIANLLTNDATFMPQYLTNPLAFGAVFGLEPRPGSGGQQILLGLDITVVWSAALLVLGYQSWSGKSFTVAAAIVLAPYALLIGVGLANSIA